MSFIFPLFLFFTFLSSFPSDTSACTVISGSRSNINVDHTVTEKQKAKVLKSYQSFQVHFGKDVEAFQKREKPVMKR
jgi:hypothetical protein